jgi:catechol 2,3-dioxygenase-like lactoylglutathione lyase family enzyme
MAIKIKGLNHYAIAVLDLEKSIAFYHDILGLDILTRPDFDFEGAWLDCGNGISLHLIVDKNVAMQNSGSRKLHFAFSVVDIQQTKELIIKLGIQILKDIKPRPDGMLQMFVADPDGYMIEFTNA